MPEYLTLEYDGTEKALADWGAAQQGAIGEQVNMRPDTFRCSIPVATINDAPIFPFESLVKLRSNRTSMTGAPGSFSGGAVDFVGYRLDPVHDGRPEYEGVHYQFANAWYLLENTPYQQPSAAYITSAVGFQFTTGLALFAKITETQAVDPRETALQLAGFLIPIDSGWQIEQVLKHALAMYATQGIAVPFQIGTIDVGLNLPVYQCQEVTCAAAIQKCLELSPDASVYWDYTTTPPTVNVSSNTTPITLAIANGVDHKSLRIAPKPTLQPSVVIIYFRITGSFTIDGNENTYVQYARQKWGPGGLNTGPDGGLRALIQTIDLAGGSTNVITQSIVCPDFFVADVMFNAAGQPAVREWWATVKPELANLSQRRMSFQDTTIYDADTGAILAYQSDVPTFVADWPYWLKDGTIHPWMRTAGNQTVAQRIRVTARVFRKMFDRAGSGDENDTSGISIADNTADVTAPFTDGEEKSVEITVTNATTGTYSQTTGTTSGEDIPGGLAEAVWNSLAALQYEGEHVKVEAEATHGVTLGNSLNLSGSHTDWETMDATIQNITKDYGIGQTSVSFGPATHLNSGDLNALFQWNRQRRPGPTAVRETGMP